MRLYDTYQQQVDECDARIESVLRRLSHPEPPTEPLPAPRHRTQQANALKFDVRAALYAMIGVDLTQIHGLGPHLSLKLISECGTDLSRWPCAKHFTSWLFLAPGNQISGGKVLSTHTRRSKNQVSALLRLAAVNVGKPTAPWGLFIGGYPLGPASPRRSPLLPGSWRYCSITPSATALRTVILGRPITNSSTGHG